MGYTQPVVQPMGIPAYQQPGVTPVQPMQTIPTQYMPGHPAPAYQPMPTQPMMGPTVYPQPMGVPMSIFISF